MRAGNLRHVILIQSRASGFQGASATETWSTAATVRGEIISTAGREYVQGQQVHADTTHMIRLRGYAGLTPKHRLKKDTRVFEIQSVNNTDDRDIETRCLCKEVVD